MSRPAVTHIRRKSSRIEAWLSEQHRIVHTHPDAGDLTPVAPKSAPYLAAYPPPSAASVDGESVASYVLVPAVAGDAPPRCSSRNASVVSTPSRDPAGQWD